MSNRCLEKILVFIILILLLSATSAYANIAEIHYLYGQPEMSKEKAKELVSMQGNSRENKKLIEQSEQRKLLGNVLILTMGDGEKYLIPIAQNAAKIQARISGGESLKKSDEQLTADAVEYLANKDFASAAWCYTQMSGHTEDYKNELITGLIEQALKEGVYQQAVAAVKYLGGYDGAAKEGLRWEILLQAEQAEEYSDARSVWYHHFPEENQKGAELLIKSGNQHEDSRECKKAFNFFEGAAYLLYDAAYLDNAERVLRQAIEDGEEWAKDELIRFLRRKNAPENYVIGEEYKKQRKISLEAEYKQRIEGGDYINVDSVIVHLPGYSREKKERLLLDAIAQARSEGEYLGANSMANQLLCSEFSSIAEVRQLKFNLAAEAERTGNLKDSAYILQSLSYGVSLKGERGTLKAMLPLLWERYARQEEELARYAETKEAVKHYRHAISGYTNARQYELAMKVQTTAQELIEQLPEDERPTSLYPYHNY